MRHHLPRIGLLLALVIAVGLLWSEVSTGRLDLEALVARMAAAGPKGWLLYVLAVTGINALGVSMHPFLVASGAIWPAPLAIVLSWIGTLGSSTIDFLAARYLFREQVERRLPARLRAYDEALEARGFRTILLLRLIFFTSHPVALLAGVSTVRFRDFIAATALGHVPLIVVVVLMSDRILSAWWA